MFIANLTLHGLTVRPINSRNRRIAHLTFAVLVAIPVTHAVNETAIRLLKDNHIKLSIQRNLTSTKFKEKKNFSSKVSIKFSF